MKKKYCLIGFKPFSEYKQGRGIILSTHYSIEKLDEAWHNYKGNLALDSQFCYANKGDRVYTDNGVWKVEKQKT